MAVLWKGKARGGRSKVMSPAHASSFGGNQNHWPPATSQTLPEALKDEKDSNKEN